MKAVLWCALACAALAWAASPQDRQDEPRQAVAKAAAARIATSTSPSKGTTSAVTLTLDTRPASAEISKGDPYAALLTGAWRNTGTGAVYLQASDSADTFVAPAPMLAGKFSTYRILLPLPTSTAAGLYTGTLTVRACADRLCVQPYADTTRSIGYALKVNAVGEWETLQRSSRHDGYVPVEINAARYRKAWTWQQPDASALSAVVTYGDKIYFSELGTSSSVYAVRAADGVSQWRRVFSSAYGSGPPLTAPTVSNGVVYVATTGHEDTWLYALRANDGLQTYQSRFYTQWANILSPTVHNDKIYVNAGYYEGVVYAYNLADGTASWNATGGTYGMNTPAVDDDYVYAHNGGTLNVWNAADGSLFTSIGPNAAGTFDDYHGTPMLGSTGHVLAYSGTTFSGDGGRQLLDYSLADQAVRWMSIALYNNYPAVAKGVVYATSNETHTFDALDEATGRRLWSWKPPEQYFNFIGNVVVTDNVAFVSTSTRIYAIDLRHHRTVWSAATPGTMSISANRMLFVSARVDGYETYTGSITAYRLY
jgi:outer membrane protein assembly factor BamB